MGIFNFEVEDLDFSGILSEISQEYTSEMEDTIIQTSVLAYKTYSWAINKEKTPASMLDAILELSSNDFMLPTMKKTSYFNSAPSVTPRFTKNFSWNTTSKPKTPSSEKVGGTGQKGRTSYSDVRQAYFVDNKTNEPRDVWQEVFSKNSKGVIR